MYELFYAGLVHGIVSVARAEGMTGLYSGLGPTLLAIAPFMAVQQVSGCWHIQLMLCFVYIRMYM